MQQVPRHNLLPEDWERASRLVEKMISIKLEIINQDGRNDWRYRVRIVNDLGAICQNVTGLDGSYRLSEMEPVERAIMNFRAGMAHAFASLRYEGE